MATAELTCHHTTGIRVSPIRRSKEGNAVWRDIFIETSDGTVEITCFLDDGDEDKLLLRDVIE